MIIFKEFILTQKIKDLEKIQNSICFSDVKVKDYDNVNSIIVELKYDMACILETIQRFNRKQDVIYIGHCIENDFLNRFECITTKIDKLLSYSWNDEQYKTIVAIDSYIKDYTEVLKELLDRPLYQVEEIELYKMVFKI